MDCSLRLGLCGLVKQMVVVSQSAQSIHLVIVYKAFCHCISVKVGYISASLVPHCAPFCGKHTCTIQLIAYS